MIKSLIDKILGKKPPRQRSAAPAAKTAKAAKPPRIDRKSVV